MSDWKTRKRNPGRGQHFRGDSSSGTTIKDVTREQARNQYLNSLLKETTTYDINEIVARIRSEGRSTITSVNKAEKEVQAAEKILTMAQGKIDVINAILEILNEIKSSGRTRIGDSELKSIVRQVTSEAGIPASVLDQV
jgi:uncharacterized protein YajQ (UPF0234 family)